MYRIFCCIFASTICAVGMPASAMAELRTLRGAGSSYTAAAPKSDTVKTKMHYRQVSPESTEAEDSNESLLQTEALTDKEIDRIWNKYRALAAGNYREEARREKEPEPAAVKTATPQDAADNAGGLAGILQEYRRNKENRRQLRTLTVTPEAPVAPQKPAAPQVNTP